jgi:hypothetical protein
MYICVLDWVEKDDVWMDDWNDFVDVLNTNATYLLFIYWLRSRRWKMPGSCRDDDNILDCEVFQA